MITYTQHVHLFISRSFRQRFKPKLVFTFIYFSLVTYYTVFQGLGVFTFFYKKSIDLYTIS